MTRRVLGLAFVLFAGVVCAMACPPARAQQVGVSWNGGTGNWSSATNWNPAVVPNNGGSSTYSVTITAPNSVVAMDLLSDTINNLKLGATDTLEVNNSLSLASGASSNGGTFIVTSSLSNDSGAHLTNNGGIGVVGGALINNSGAVLTNDGTIGLSDLALLDNSGTLTNNSTITSAVDSAITNEGHFTNAGTINFDAGLFSNTGTFTNRGTMAVTSSFDPSAFSNAGQFKNSGTLNFSLVFNSSSFSNSGTMNNSGTINLVYGCAGMCNGISNSGTINNTGTLNISVASNVTLEAPPVFSNSGTINNKGTLSNGAGSTIDNTGVINNSGQFTNAGALIISGGGSITTHKTYTQTDGSTVVDGSLAAKGWVDIQGGMLSGNGTIKGNVQVGGTMMPGDAPGTLTIAGNYEQMSGGIFDELMSPTSQSLLDVSGNVMLDSGAELQITLLDGFDPLGQTFDIMDFSGLTGEFANGSSFWDDGFLWDITYGQNQIDVTATTVQAPEPSAFLLLAAGLAGLLGLRCKSSIRPRNFLRVSIL